MVEKIKNSVWFEKAVDRAIGAVFTAGLLSFVGYAADFATLPRDVKQLRAEFSQVVADLKATDAALKKEHEELARHIK